MLPAITGIHHVALTVTDAERSADWYERVLGFTRAATVPTEAFHRIALRHPAGLLLTLLQHRAGTGEAFTEQRTGLDHLAFAVPDADAVEAWAAHLDELGIDRSAVKDGALPASRLVVFRDPDGVQLECYCSA